MLKLGTFIYSNLAIIGRKKLYGIDPTCGSAKCPDQCDQMTKLCVHYLAVYSNKIWHKSIQIVPKLVENCPKPNTVKYIVKSF